jgi:prevent-host-death family protein
MTSVSAFTAKRLFAQLLRRVERGEEIVITRHGKAVARLVPAAAKTGCGTCHGRVPPALRARERRGRRQVRVGGMACLP